MKKIISIFIVMLIGILILPRNLKANELPSDFDEWIFEYYIKEIDVREFDKYENFRNKYYPEVKTATLKPDIDNLIDYIKNTESLYYDIKQNFFYDNDKEWLFEFANKYTNDYSFYHLSKSNFDPNEFIVESSRDRFESVDPEYRIGFTSDTPLSNKSYFIKRLFDYDINFYKNIYHPDNYKYQFSFTYFDYDINDYKSSYFQFLNKELNELPKTNESKVAGVTFTYDQFNNLEAKIKYENKFYYLNRSFESDTDMSIFDTVEAYYMNRDNKPQIIINHSDRPYLRDILEAPDNEKPAFVPNTIWDLTTNKFKTVSEYNTYVYLKQNHRSVMMAYMYIDEFIIDKLLTVELSWTSRVEHGFIGSIINGGKYSDWERKTETLASDEYLEYKKLTSSWQHYIPYWNYYVGIRDLSKVYTMPRIDSVNFNNIQSDYNITKSEYETYMFSLNDEFKGLSSNHRYKVWALALGQGLDWFSEKSEFYHNKDNLKDPYNFNIIRMTYETNGELYEAVGEDMNIVVKVNPKDDGLENEKDNGPGLITTIIFFGAFGLWILAIFMTKAFTPKKFIFVTLILFAVYAAALFGWGYVKSGKILLKVIKIL